ncbi:MAG TPA: substrate-binding domain-containing protein [Casimicrobiaceae bacterium]|nr:substrate-binding domain-containing protein [Casimicrobiaceae bacterium]
MTELHVLSAGAAKGVVLALAAALESATGATLRGEFGAVGAMKEKMLAGAPCDVVILTAAMLEALARDGLVVADSIRSLGRVRTGVAVRAGEPAPPIADRAQLRSSLLAARRLYLPDTERSTAGAHCLKVLRVLGIHDAVCSRVRSFESGAVAMSELARSTGPWQLGCTQITEINYTPGVALVGPLPPEFELATVYSAAVAVAAQHPELALRSVELYTGSESLSLREAGGFER